MNPLAMTKPMNHPRGWVIAVLVVAGWLGFSAALAQQKEKKPHYTPHPSAENVKLVTEAWKTAPRKPLSTAELDRLLTEAQQKEKEKVAPAPLVTDEQFIRRATLDLTGKLPSPAQIEEFVKSPESDKRAK